MFITASTAWLVTQPELQMINKKIITILFLPFCFLLGTAEVFGQIPVNLQEGLVSYISGQNIYVKFLSTSGIENGDTLFITKNEILTPALIVQHRSSISCLCIPIGTNSFKVSDKIFSKRKTAEIKEQHEIQAEEQSEKDVSETVLTKPVEEKVKRHEQNINGRLSLSSYSNFSNSETDDVHRFRYTLSANAANISDSKLSAETYISFTHKLNEWELVKEDLNNALKIYSLALKYDLNEMSSVWAGRKINPRIANVGAIDGLQFEYGFGKMFAGVVAGSRPDYKNYGYNFSLFEYGVYFGQSSKTKNGFIQSSLAFFEQRNSSNIDRRFIYFQHSNSLAKNLNVFSSFELDLYKLENENPSNTLSLTSFYLSLNYRVSRQLSLFGSYDNRKNVIYYETFRNYSDEILQQASRQGFRVRVNYRPVNYLMLGINAGTRFRKEDPRPTKTLNGTIGYTKIPFINSSLTLSANLMQTSYLEGQIYGARLTKDIIQGKLYGMLNYRRVGFTYVNSNSTLKQNIAEVDLSYQFNKKLYLSVNFETTFQENGNNNRLYLNLRRKF